MSEKITIAITVEEIKAVVREAVGPVCQERDALRVRVAELESANQRLRAACERTCRETDWCPVCEQHPSTHHQESHPLVDSAGHSAGHSPDPGR